MAGRGVAGWLRVLRTTTDGTSSPERRPAPRARFAVHEVVGILASMALACVEERR
ncbi:MAG: hypothetical protein ACT4OP_08095 [Actinomycetota bacterium]